MSWSVSAMGKGAAVKKSIAAQVGPYKMNEPEQTMQDKAVEIINAACDGAPEDGFTVSAYGSQGTNNGKIVSMGLKLELNLVKFAE